MGSRTPRSESASLQARNTICVSCVAVPQLQHQQRQMTSTDLAQHKISSYTFSLAQRINIKARQKANEWTRESPVKEKHQIGFSLILHCSGWVSLVFIFWLTFIVYSFIQRFALILSSRIRCVRSGRWPAVIISDNSTFLCIKFTVFWIKEGEMRFCGSYIYSLSFTECFVYACVVGALTLHLSVLFYSLFSSWRTFNDSLSFHCLYTIYYIEHSHIHRYIMNMYMYCILYKYINCVECSLLFMWEIKL